MRPAPFPLLGFRPTAAPALLLEVPFDAKEAMLPYEDSRGGIDTVALTHRCRRALIATIILTLSPTLRTPISLSACWSTSSKTSPRMSLVRKTSAYCPTCTSYSHLPT